MTHTPQRPLAASALLALLAGSAAALAQQAPPGLTIRHEAQIDAPAARVYEALVDVGSWWNSQHTYSGDARNLSIDARAGGCFCEKLPRGGSVEHMRVIHAAPGEMLRLSGGLGPFQGSAVAGSMTWRLTSAPGGTKVALTYSLGGFMEGGFEKIEAPASAMLGEGMARLEAFIETGNPVQSDRPRDAPR